MINDDIAKARLKEQNIHDILFGGGTQRDKAARNGCSQALVCYVTKHKGRYASW